MAITQQMRTDWNNYWNNTGAGAVQAWGNGVLFRNVDGSATYRSKTGGDTNFNAGMSIEDFAKSNPEIGNILSNNYGYKTDTPPTTPTFSTPSVTTPTAATGSVGDDMLVEKRLNGLLAANSPLIQQARAKAAQAANSRGLLNSALAAGMGEEAAISQALPIATTDANTFFRQAVANQEAQNAASIAAANAANQASIAKAGYEAQAQINSANNAAAAQRQADQYRLESELLDKKNSTSAADRAGQQLWQLGGDYINKSLSTQSWMTDKIAAIQSSNVEDKQGAIAGIQDMAASMQTSINAVYSKVPGWKQEWLVVAKQGG